MSSGRGATKIDVFLASLTHPSLAPLEGVVDGITLDGTLRVANWRHPFVSRGNTFAPGYFRVQRPKLGDRRGQLRVVLDNVDKRLTDVVRALTGKPSLTLEMVWAHEPDTVRRTWKRLELQVFTATAPTLSGTFGPPPTEGETMGIKVSPDWAPGAFS